MPHDDLQLLLDGDAVTLLITFSGLPFDHQHQCRVALGTVPYRRRHQMRDQAVAKIDQAKPVVVGQPKFSGVYKIEIAGKAFQEASELSNHHNLPGAIELDMHNILPGYAMCVLDWYVKALQKSKWPVFEFSDGGPVPKGEDMWY